MSGNFVDSTTVHAVDSLFRGNHVDPYSRTLAGKLADLFIYADVLRYPVPVPGSGTGHDLIALDSVLHCLASRDSEAFRGERYSTAEPRLIADNLLLTAFDRFSAWATANSSTLRQWLALHHEPWVQAHWRAVRTSGGYTFVLDQLAKEPGLRDLVTTLGVAESDVLYAFDSVLKYPLYGELTGPNNYYLNHPMRDAFLLPATSLQVGTPPQIAISFAQSVSEMAPDLTQDEYSVLLHELRAAVRSRRIHEMPPGEVDGEVVRDIAAEVKLPARVSENAKRFGLVAGAGLGILGALNPLTMPVAILGAGIAVASAYWKLPRQLAAVTWLRWALRWEVEDAVEQRG